MTRERESRTRNRRPAATAAILALAVLLPAAVAAGGHAKAPKAATPEPTWTQTRDAPEIKDTAANLQAAFANEMNARESYLAYAKQAEAEGYPAVARVFRACAKAESIHARRTVQAIAMTGQPARAMLDRVNLGMTVDNLRNAISGETYERDVLYPALIARAKTDHQPMAVRSLTLALGTERQHVRLMENALEHLDERPVAATIWVCPYCGRTTDTLEYRKCPGCFTSTSRFLRPA